MSFMNYFQNPSAGTTPEWSSVNLENVILRQEHIDIDSGLISLHHAALCLLEEVRLSLFDPF